MTEPVLGVADRVPVARVVIVGAGAMGCLFAVRLTRAGAKVTLVDVVAERLTAIEAQGVALTDEGGTHLAQVEARRATQVEAIPDLVMLFTKGVQTAAAARSVAHLAGPDTYALTLQNGLGNAETIAEVFAPERVLLGATDFPADLHGHGQVSSHGAGSVWLGCLRESDEGRRMAETVADLFLRAGLKATVDREIHVAIWEKAAFNAAMNTLTMVTGQRVGGINQPAGRAIARDIASEVTVAARANGFGLDLARILDRIQSALDGHPNHMPSMLQDRLAHRRTEVDTINDALVRAGAARGVDMPVTRTLADLVRLIEAAECGDA